MPWRDSTCNVRNTPDLPRPAVRRCGAIVAQHSDSAGFQEIAEREDHLDLKVKMPEKWWWWNDAGGKEVPQAFRKRMWLPAEDRLLPAWASPFMHEKISDSIPGANPTRYLSASFVVRRAGNIELPICEIDVHTANGAFSKPGQRKEELRLPRFHQGMTSVETFIDRVLGVGDISIVLKGDFNATIRHLDEYVARKHWLWTTGIDNIAIINAPAGNKIRCLPNGKTSTDDPSDHNLRTALLGMRAA